MRANSLNGKYCCQKYVRALIFANKVEERHVENVKVRNICTVFYEHNIVEYNNVERARDFLILSCICITRKWIQ